MSGGDIDDVSRSVAGAFLSSGAIMLSMVKDDEFFFLCDVTGDAM